MWAAIAATVASTIFSANAAQEQGKQQQQAAQYQAQQLDQNAGQQQAAAQRAAMEQRRRGMLAQSRALAIAAASGGGHDPTTVDIIGDLAQETTYRSMLDLYEGDDKARLLRQQAAGARYGGEVARQAGSMNATASILKGGTSLLWMKYAPGGAPGPTKVGGSSIYDAGTPLATPYG